MNTAAGPDSFALDGAAVRRSFERAAAGYDRHAVLQAEVRAGLLGRLEPMAIDPRLVVDAGAGTGHSSRALGKRYPKATVVALDQSPAMLREARTQRRWLRPFARVCADACRLPLADGGVDLVFSNLLLHWCGASTLFAEVRRVLAPRGLFAFSCLGVDTLAELREAWSTVDAAPHVHLFHDMHTLGDALVHAGFAAPVLDVERYTLHYADLDALVADLRGSGAGNADPGRPRGLLTPRRRARLVAAYESRRADGRLPATAEVIYGHAWVPENGRMRTRGDAGTVTSIALDALRAQLPRREPR